MENIAYDGTSTSPNKKLREEQIVGAHTKNENAKCTGRVFEAIFFAIIISLCYRRTAHSCWLLICIFVRAAFLARHGTLLV